MVAPTIKELVKDNWAGLEYVQDGALHYYVLYGPLECKNDNNEFSLEKKVFRFTVPFEDVAGGRFETREKAMTLMRWIRKQLEENEKNRGIQK